MIRREVRLPLYEYRCRKCGKRFEKIQKFQDPPVSRCPDCGAAAERLLSAPAIQFKGSGWYVTDYARKDRGETTKTETGSERGEKASSKGGEKKDCGPAKSPDTSKTPTSKES